MESIVLACALPEGLLPAYRFSPRWLVRYRPCDPEYARGERFRAMGLPKGGGGAEGVFVVSLVIPSKVIRGRVRPGRSRAADDYVLSAVAAV